MSGPRAGRYRDKVTIQAPPALDSYGQPVTNDYSVVATRRCDITARNSKEYYAGAGEGTETRFEIRFRYENNLIGSNYRLIDNSQSPARVFDLDGAPFDPTNERRELVCVCVVRQ